MANKIFTSAVFSGPKFSYFDCSHPNQLSMKFGDCVPIYWDFLNPNDKATFDMSQVVRVSPMLQPILSQIDITVDAFAVRLRSLGMAERDPWTYEDFFNANKNLDGSVFLPRAEALTIGKAANFKLGSLYDYLGYPTLDALRRYVRRFVSRYPFLTDSSIGYYVKTVSAGVGEIGFETYFGSLSQSAMFAPILGAALVTDPNIGETDPTYTDPVSFEYYDENSETDYLFDAKVSDSYYRVCPLSIFALYYALTGTALDAITPASILSTMNGSIIWLSTDTDDNESPYRELLRVLTTKSLPDYIYDKFKVDWQSVVESWFDFVFRYWVIAGIDGSGDEEVSFADTILQPIFTDSVGTVMRAGWIESYSDNPIEDFSPQDDDSIMPVTPTLPPFDEGGDSTLYSPLYPALSYWKIMSDWYLNTGLYNPDDWFLNKVYVGGDKANGYNLRALFGSPYKRNWSPDYFTTAFSSAQRGLAVGIPADGTIPDLRNASALQKFKERLLFAGHKFRDVIYSIFGIKMSSAIADMSEVLGRWVNPVNIDSTLQTSASSPTSPLGNYAGTGLSFGHKKNILHYVAEEPTVIMFVASIRPKYATYYQGFPKKLRRNYLMDYAIPGFSNIGEQMISSREVYCDIGATEYSTIFGFTRRFADFMYSAGECHGDFKDSLDSWHLARQFDEEPLLNQQFLEVNPVADNLNRIFATTSDAVDKFYCNFFISGGIVRSIPKRLYYDL